VVVQLQVMVALQSIPEVYAGIQQNIAVVVPQKSESFNRIAERLQTDGPVAIFRLEYQCVVQTTIKKVITILIAI